MRAKHMNEFTRTVEVRSVAECDDVVVTFPVIVSELISQSANALYVLFGGSDAVFDNL